MTASERIRQARELRDLNEILAECGEPETTLEELERNGIELIAIEELGGPETVSIAVVF